MKVFTVVFVVLALGIDIYVLFGLRRLKRRVRRLEREIDAPGWDREITSSE